MTYSFIKQNENLRDTNRPVCYLAIGETTIETLTFSETYGDYGQQIDAGTAGDSIELESDKAKTILKEVEEQTECEAKVETFGNECLIMAHNNSHDLYDTLLERLQEECADEDYVLNQEEVQGFDYWNGHNHATVITSYSNVDYEITHEEIEDEELIKELNQAIEEMEFLKEGFGRKIYQTEKYWIEDNYCEGHFESYAIYNKEEIDIEEL